MTDGPVKAYNLSLFFMAVTITMNSNKFCFQICQSLKSELYVCLMKSLRSSLVSHKSNRPKIIFLTPPPPSLSRVLVHRRATYPHFPPPPSIKFADTHLKTWVRRRALIFSDLPLKTTQWPDQGSSLDY